MIQSTSKKQKEFYDVKHFKKILHYSIPTMIAISLTLAIELVNVAFAGRLNDPYQMAGLGLGSMIASCWIAMYTGLNGALETMAS